MYSPYMSPAVSARPSLLFQGVAGQKNSHQMFFSDKYVTFSSDGDFKIYEKESDYQNNQLPYRIIKADEIDGEVQISGKVLKISVPSISKSYEYKLGSESDAMYWKDSLDGVIQQKRLARMTGAAPAMSMYGAVPGVYSPGTYGAASAPSAPYSPAAPAYSPAAPAYSPAAPAYSAAPSYSPATMYSPGGMGGFSAVSPAMGFAPSPAAPAAMSPMGGTATSASIAKVRGNAQTLVGGFQDSLRQNAQLSSESISRISWPAVTRAIEDGVGKIAAAEAGQAETAAADAVIVDLKKILRDQLTAIGFPNPAFVIDNNNFINWDSTLRFIKVTANEVPKGTAITSSKAPSSTAPAPTSSGNFSTAGAVGAAVVGAGIVGGAMYGASYNTMAPPQAHSYVADARPLASSSSSSSSSMSMPHVSMPHVNLPPAPHVSMPNFGGNGGGSAPQMYVPSMGQYSGYGSSAVNATGNFVSNVGSSVINDTAAMMNNMNLGKSANAVGTALAAAGGAIVGAVTSDTTMKMLKGLGELATNIPLIGVIGVSMKLFFDAAALAKYNKKAADALTVRVKEVGDILVEICATVTCPSATMNSQLQNLDSLIKEIIKYLEKFAQRSYLSRLLTGSSDDATIKNFDKQLMDLIALVQMTVGVKSIQLQQRALTQLDDVTNLIKDKMSSKRLPGEDDGAVMAKLTPEDINAIASACGVSNEDLKGEINAKLDEIAASQKRMESKIDVLVSLQGGTDNLSMANEKAKRFWDEYFNEKSVSYESFLIGFEEEFNQGRELSASARDKVIRCIDIPNSSGRGDGNISYIEWKRFFRSIFADSNTDFSTSFDVAGYIESKLKCNY